MIIKARSWVRTAGMLSVLALFVFGGSPSIATSTASQDPPPRPVVPGEGDFPRLPVIALRADGSTLALYLVEGDTASQLAVLEGPAP